LNLNEAKTTDTLRYGAIIITEFSHLLIAQLSEIFKYRLL